MRKNITYIFLALLTGFFAGMYFTGYTVNENLEVSSVGETNYYLAMANQIRKGDHSKAVEHYESMIETHVKHFTKNGEGLVSLNENDTCVLDKVIRYWKEECQEKCFMELIPIFEMRKIRITSGCN